MRQHEPSEPVIFDEAEWHAIVEGLSLSPRQSQIIRLLIGGASDKQMALHLGISVPTVRTHLQRMYWKFGVQDRIGLVVHVFAWFRKTDGSESTR